MARILGTVRWGPASWGPARGWTAKAWTAQRAWRTGVIAVPLVLVGVLGGLMAAGTFDSPNGRARLPATTAAQLVSAVRTAPTIGYTATALTQVSLDNPALTAVAGQAPFGALLTGSHSLAVWYGGPDRQRIALLAPADETDLFRVGAQVWQWDSAGDIATRDAATGPVTLMPAELAQRLLAGGIATTSLTTRRGPAIAGRATYELDLAPQSRATLVGEIRIVIDGATKVPLRVQLYARGGQTPAITVQYTTISFGTPPAAAFQFTPPPGATVRTAPQPPEVAASGSGWQQVLTFRLPAARLAPVLHLGAPVAGPWGSGTLFTSPLLSVLVTRDGRDYAGSVPPASLYAAAAR